MEVMTLKDWDAEEDEDPIDDRRREKPELGDPKDGTEPEVPEIDETEIDDTTPTTGIQEVPHPKKIDEDPFPLFPITDLPSVPGIRKPTTETPDIN